MSHLCSKLNRYKAISEGNFDVTPLLNFRDMKRSGSHEINREVLSAQSQAVGIPILHMDFIFQPHPL